MNKIKTKIQCHKCENWFSAKGGNHKKHIDACNGDYSPPGKSESCKYCSLTFDGMATSQRANHSRWCNKNPKRDQYVSNHNGCKQMQTPEAIAKRHEGVRRAHAEGKYVGAAKKAAQTRIDRGNNKHSDKTIELLRQKALASPHRRLVRSIRQYTKKDGTVVILDSSWEEALAIRLDEIGVNWVRPGAIKWVDDNSVTHNYFPDFYLIDFDLYLDPKNPYAIKAQQSKIKCLTEQIKNLVILKGLDECKNYTPLRSGQNIF
jgi:hypothetical protein